MSDDVELRRAMCGATQEEIDALKKTDLHKSKCRIENAIDELTEKLDYLMLDRTEQCSRSIADLTMALINLDELEFLRWVRKHNGNYEVGDRPPNPISEGKLN